MYTAFQLLDKINSHISDIQFTRTPAGLYDPIKYVLSMGGKRIFTGSYANGIQPLQGGCVLYL